MTTGGNRELNFSDWYVVLTSNIGAQRIMALRKSKFETMERLVRQEAQRELRPEIFARINAVVVFNKLDFDTQRVIARDMIESECAAQGARGCDVRCHAAVPEVVIQCGFNDRLGARPMGISPHTVNTHRKAIMAKLKLHHKGQLMLYAVQHGYIWVTGANVYYPGFQRRLQAGARAAPNERASA